MADVVEDRGLEPRAVFDVTENHESTCVRCQEGSAARALHTGSTICHLMSSLDVDLQRVIVAWDGLPVAIRKAIATLLECKESSDG
jgi:hypothetical protein